MSKTKTNKTEAPKVVATTVVGSVAADRGETTASAASYGGPAEQPAVSSTGGAGLAGEVRRTAIGMCRADQGYAVYTLKVEGDRVVDFQACSIDPGEPFLSHQGAINLLKRYFVELFVLEGRNLEEML